MKESEFSMLDRLIGPVDSAAFFSRNWEKEPLHLSRDEPERFGDLLTLGDVDRILAEQTFRQGDMRIVDTREPVSRADYMHGNQVDLAKLYDLFQRGATVVFERLDGKWLPLRRLCRAMEQELGHPAQANIYLTPGSNHGRRGEQAQGLKRHYDTHDVFVLQVAGSKTWSLFDQVVELPLKSQPPRPEDYQAMEVRETVTMKAGDTLYIPRGFVHDAQATEDSSLHITLGILSYTWATLLGEAVQIAAREDASLRRSLPRHAGAEFNLQEELAGALARLGAGDTLSRAWKQVDDHFVTGRAPMLEGQMEQLAALASLDETSVFAPRETSIVRFEVRELELAVIGQRGEVVFPLQVEDAVRFALAGPRYSLADIPGGLDEAGRLVLVRRLIREGLVAVAT